MKIVVGGQIDKQDIANIIKAELGEEAEVTVKGDLDATMGMEAERWPWLLPYLERQNALRFLCQDKFAAKRRFARRLKAEKSHLGLRHSIRKQYCRSC